MAKTIGHSAYQITSLVNKMLAIANDSTKDLMAQATETDGIAICCKAIENMPVVDAEKVKVLHSGECGEVYRRGTYYIKGTHGEAEGQEDDALQRGGYGMRYSIG